MRSFSTNLFKEKMRQKSYGFSIALLLSIIMPIDLYAKYITADEFTNAYDYFKGYEYDFQVDSIFYTFHDFYCVGNRWLCNDYWLKSSF